ncbi:Cu(I)-responsive transcriptional regulator [Allohahella sp. A8]|uniref:Cu(I)-responsive transcriptional regulator n=1 Tax=Allohahella sp. A8 TaxID=3141461 RepID=UPI000C0A1087|nr:Cu(I)-responsive transcriptional regulator [Hahellaceae bacterium]|tara:strand:- start:1211 stop:1609 length:399 start_codon:yes stop_codon:yes gene_type:complete
MNIGQAAKASGITAKMLRHYESIGLIRESRRSEAGYRLYTQTDLHTLRFVKHARSMGFALDDIRQLLSLWQDGERASADVKALAMSHMADLDEKIRVLTEMRAEIEALAERCHGDDRPDCPIISGLAAEDDN